MRWFVFSATAFRENIIRKKGVEHESTSTLACLTWCGTKVSREIRQTRELKTCKISCSTFLSVMKTSKTKQVLEPEDGEKAVLSGQVVTPASVQYYGFKRNRLRFSLKRGEVVLR